MNGEFFNGLLYFDISDFRRSHHVINVRAWFGRIIRIYPPSAAGLTSNERSVALTLFKSVARTAIQPASSAPVIAAKCTVAIGTQVPSREEPGELLQRGRPEELRE